MKPNSKFSVGERVKFIDNLNVESPARKYAGKVTFVKRKKYIGQGAEVVTMSHKQGTLEYSSWFYGVDIAEGVK